MAESKTAKVTEKIDGFREKLQGVNQLMKSQVQKLKTDASHKRKYEGYKILFDFNTVNLKDLVQTLWAIDNGKRTFCLNQSDPSQSQETIAITDRSRAINVFNMNKETVTKEIKFNKACCGLSFLNNFLVVGLDNNEIRNVDLEGNTLRSIPVQSKSILDCFVNCKDRIIYSDYKDKGVHCVDESGTQIWEYKQDISFPNGLCTDSFGNIFVADYASSRISVISKDGQNSKAMASSKQCDINNMTLNIETKIEINMDEVIIEMICLLDGRVIVVGSKGKVNLLTSDGKYQKQLHIPGQVKSVTQINQDTIALTYFDERIIHIFNMENETVTKVITLDKVCYGLSFSNNSLALGLSSDEIRIIDLEGNTLKSIPVQSKSVLAFFVHWNDRVIYNDYKDKAVYCVDKSGTKIWEYKQNLYFPKGLCTDSYGNIFVADFGLDGITVISKDGQDSKALISEKEELKHPMFIRFKHNESSGFICDHYGKYLAKFNLCSG
ncbi:uncharacterized protein LOC134709895 [Mytilus trossulus]|uniref:uncharacterized protein LOC134709895 n=1 Tax=Mytilus trossulus TaxID=6551 RepID=UPI003005E6E4